MFTPTQRRQLKPLPKRRRTAHPTVANDDILLGGSDKHDEDLNSEGNCADHLQQPGNTKKRKVPVNMSASVNGREASLPLAVEEGRSDPDLGPRPSPVASRRRGKMSSSTLAGLQHKELLKHRKRQLAAVLGALSLGDALALDQALSTHLPFVATSVGAGATPARVRLSHRRGPRLARAAAVKTSSARKAAQKGVAFPTAQFTFTFPNATSDRLIATKEEVLALRSRFEAELARQAARATQAAAEAKQAVILAGNRPSRTTKRLGKAQPSLLSGDQSGDGFRSEMSASGRSRGGKKKKRNGLDVASNPHHRNNYVPSRLPSTSGQHVSTSTTLGPLPLRFLSATLPVRRGMDAPKTVMVNPADEWICPGCEYSLFYGDGTDYRRAVRERKQILRRRRRAQKRVADGLGATKKGVESASEDELEYGSDEEEEEEYVDADADAEIRVTKGQSG